MVVSRVLSKLDTLTPIALSPFHLQLASLLIKEVIVLK